MKKFNKISVLAGTFIFGLVGSIAVFAATSPSLGMAGTFSILSSTYTNTVIGTTVNGDLGYTTGPAVVPTVSGTTHTADITYNQSGIDQNSALSSLASQPCTYTFPNGAIDLATDTTRSGSTIGVYTPGVYCISGGAASIGAGGITLSGNGTFLFRISGALTTVANSSVVLDGASACDVFWTPTQATTLAANSTFVGNVIDNAGITIGANSSWLGTALAFGGTVTTDKTNITAPICTAAITVIPVPNTILPKLHIIKHVINGTGGTAVSSDFT
ncbi:MAG: ice-binding family protein, partial [Candidatus Gracilibacteria bacterium]|nr:ice-binding family protein [Candidatus Gracilibacteria bacterium]